MRLLAMASQPKTCSRQLNYLRQADRIGLPFPRCRLLMTDASAAEAHRFQKKAFESRDFTRYWLARLLGRFGTEILITGVSWQAYQLTGNPFDLGLIGLAQFAPFILLFLIAGAAADKFQRTRILGFSALLQTLCTLLLYLFTAARSVDFSQIFLILVVLGIARAFQSPAQQAVMPLLVPTGHFASAVAWTNTGNQLARIGGPACAGGLLIIGQEAVYATAIVCLALSTVLTFMIRTNTQQVSPERLSWSRLLAGFGFIWSRPIILGTIVLDLFAVLLGGATALLPIYAADILQVGEAGFGGLRAAHMMGAFTCALYLTQWPLKRRAGRKMLGTVAVFGAAIVVFGLSTWFWLSLIALFTMGASDAISVYVRSYIAVVITPDAMRGRVSAVNSAFIGASNELGEFESGVTAAWWGVVPAVVVGGLSTIAVTVLCALWLPQLRQVDSLDHDDLVRRYR